MTNSKQRLRPGFTEEVETTTLKPVHVPVHAGFEPRLRLWLLRMLCDHGVVWSDQFDPRRFIEDTRSLMPVSGELATDHDGLYRHYQTLLDEAQGKETRVGGVLATNLATLGSGLSLGRVERDLLAFLVVYDALPCFEHVVDVVMAKTDAVRVGWQLASILGVSHIDIERSLNKPSLLIAGGFVEVNDSFKNLPLNMLIEVNRRMARMLTQPGFKLSDLLEYAARPGHESSLSLADYEHMDGQRDLVAGYLTAIRRDQVGAATVLFDGPPGVGKTELARLLATELGFEPWEINEQDFNGDTAVPHQRFQFLRICQLLVERSDHPLIIFDEADAVIGDVSGQYMKKAAMIHHLENLTVPVIWITNHGENIAPAVLRRMDLHIRFEPLPETARERMLNQVLNDVGGKSEWLASLCREEQVTPARIAQADRVARLIAGRDGQGHDQLVQQVLHENLGLDRKAQSRGCKSTFELPYGLDRVNADEDLPALVAALKREPRARLCLYGPPGTGKTRFVRYLAESCRLKLREYRASDLLDMWVGASEQKIRQMFEDSDRSGDLLFLDEADSLVADRAGASHRFEVSQVNELLKGLEGFSGLFVASTNLMDRLDPAVMRRLDFKIHFGWLKPNQRWRLFIDLARHAGVSVRGLLAQRLRRQLDGMHCLTPGDFALLARRLSLRPISDAEALLDLLERETRHKPEVHSQAGIGFTARLDQH